LSCVPGTSGSQNLSWYPLTPHAEKNPSAVPVELQGMQSVAPVLGW
jgi:hypothetical protein